MTWFSHTYVCRHTLISGTWLIHMCDITDSYVWPDAFIWLPAASWGCTYEQKSPIYPQKKPISPQKSPVHPIHPLFRINRALLWRYWALLRIYRTLLGTLQALLRLFTCVPVAPWGCAYGQGVSIYRVLLRRYMAVMWIYKTLWQIYRALLRPRIQDGEDA